MTTTSAPRLRRLILAGSLSLLTVAAFAAPMTTMARGGASVVRTGSCTASSDWKIKLGKDNSRIEVEFEVDQNRVGKVWTVNLRQDGTSFFSGHRTTVAPSGSFSINVLTTDRAGVHTFTGRAVNAATGEVCKATASI